MLQVTVVWCITVRYFYNSVKPEVMHRAAVNNYVGSTAGAGSSSCRAQRIPSSCSTKNADQHQV